MKQNIATDREQSQRLLGAGVKPETADMFRGVLSDGTHYLVVDNGDICPDELMGTPAWSLSALLALLPMQMNEDGLQTVFQLTTYPDELKWSAEYYDFYMDKYLFVGKGYEPIEACVKAIEWLTANGYSLNDIEQ